MSEPIRLVCTACDTVHRVHSVTLGKLYRCKKCRAPLTTMSPAIVRCPVCNVAHPPALVDVSRLITCTSCAEAPLMTLEFPPALRPVREIRTAAQASSIFLPDPDEDDPDDRAPVWIRPPESPPAAEAPESPPKQHLAAPPPATEPTPTEGDAAAARQHAEERPADEKRSDTDVRAASGETAHVAAERVDDHEFSDAGALVLRETERPAISALQTALEEALSDAQAPLVAEIERTRGSVPIWAVALAALPVLAALGYLLNVFLKAERQQADMHKQQLEIQDLRKSLQTKDLLLSSLKNQRDEARQSLTEYKAALQAAVNEREALREKVAASQVDQERLQAYQRGIVELNSRLDAWKKAGMIWAQKLRDLGHDPQALAREQQEP